MSFAAAFTYVATSPELQRLVASCESHQLTAFETEFLGSIRSRRHPPTEKQMAILHKIASGIPNYEAINAAAIRALPEILPRWLPDGKQSGREYVALNPKRADRAAGSFAVNTTTGRWADFASGDRGGDTIALAAWLFDLTQPEAARRVATMLGLSTDEVAIG